ncbi:MAG: hypothetical protein AAF716_00850 [Cyanobacteria bacterium P01_D01_bin.1]
MMDVLELLDEKAIAYDYAQPTGVIGNRALSVVVGRLIRCD